MIYIRNIGVFAYLVLVPAYADLSAPQIEMMTEKIKLDRVGAKEDLYKKIRSPYESIAKTQKKNPNSETVKGKVFILSAIMNDKAFLNSRWVKKDDIIDEYKVVFIKENSVRLMLDDDIINISLKKNIDIIDISEEKK